MEMLEKGRSPLGCRGVMFWDVEGHLELSIRGNVTHFLLELKEIEGGKDVKREGKGSRRTVVFLMRELGERCSDLGFHVV